MAKPLRLPEVEEQRVLEEVEIHLLLDRDQQQRWNQHILEEHCLHSATLVGEQLRYAVSYQGQWLALLGWSAPAWHLKARDQWVNWSEQQRQARLHFFAQNSRFLIRADRTQLPNLGARAMKLCLDRLSADWLEHHGHPLLALESFVDGQLFRGAIYKAANWIVLGPTAGFGRVAALEVETATLAWQEEVLGPSTDPLAAIDGKSAKHSGANSVRQRGRLPLADQRQPGNAFENGPTTPRSPSSREAGGQSQPPRTTGRDCAQRGADPVGLGRGGAPGLPAPPTG